MSGVGREQRVQRVEPDEGRSVFRCAADHRAQVGEITDAPVAARAQRVELHGDAPEPGARGDCRRLVALTRRHDDRAVRERQRRHRQAQAMISGWQLRQLERAPRKPAPLDLATLVLVQRLRNHVAAQHGAVLQRERPVQMAVGRIERHDDWHAPRIGSQHGHGLNAGSPAFQVDCGDFAVDGGGIVHCATHRREDGAARLAAEVSQLAAIVVVGLAEPAAVREFLEPVIGHRGHRRCGPAEAPVQRLCRRPRAASRCATR